jgi:hypothetical protein
VAYDTPASRHLLRDAPGTVALLDAEFLDHDPPAIGVLTASLVAAALSEEAVEIALAHPQVDVAIAPVIGLLEVVLGNTNDLAVCTAGSDLDLLRGGGAGAALSLDDDGHRTLRQQGGRC